MPVTGGDEATENHFVAEATSAQLFNLAGHRSVGGIRASLYNAMPLAGVQALIAFMTSFKAKRAVMLQLKLRAKL